MCFSDLEDIHIRILIVAVEAEPGPLFESMGKCFIKMPTYGPGGIAKSDNVPSIEALFPEENLADLRMYVATLTSKGLLQKSNSANDTHAYLQATDTAEAFALWISEVEPEEQS